MKRIATAALAVCLLSGTAALAQPQPQHNNNNNNGGHNNGVHNNGGQPHYSPQVHNFQGGPHNNTPQIVQHNFQGGPQVYQYNQGGPQNFHPGIGAPGFNPGGPRPHYSPQFFPHVFNPGARFHWRGGFWRGPPGWYYHSWYYGQYLPYGWFASEWWINDYWDYDLPVPPYGYEWVRNGPDALLINVYTGFVAEVVPGIFYY